MVDKVVESGNQKVMITERGTQFGYNDLMADEEQWTKRYRRRLETYWVQKLKPDFGAGGNPEYIESLARAGIVNDVDGIFLETHTDPSKAKVMVKYVRCK